MFPLRCSILEAVKVRGRPQAPRRPRGDGSCSEGRTRAWGRPGPAEGLEEEQEKRGPRWPRPPAPGPSPCARGGRAGASGDGAACVTPGVGAPRPPPRPGHGAQGSAAAPHYARGTQKR